MQRTGRDGFSTDSNAEGIGAMQYTYYRFDASKLTLAELWRCSNNRLEFVIAAICKLFGVNTAPPFGIANADRLVRVAPAAVPEYARREVMALSEQAQTLGMTPGLCFTHPTVGAVRGYGWHMYGGDRATVMAISYVRIVANAAVQEKALYAFVSELQDGRYLITAGSKQEEDSPPNYEGEYLRGQPMKEVLQRHRERLRYETATPVPVANEAQLERFVFEYERGSTDYQVERRLFVPMSIEEVERLRGMAMPEPAANDRSNSEPPKRRATWLEWACWFALGFGAYLFTKGHANQAQLVFRLCLVGAGLIGTVLFQIARLARGKL